MRLSIVLCAALLIVGCSKDPETPLSPADAQVGAPTDSGVPDVESAEDSGVSDAPPTTSNLCELGPVVHFTMDEESGDVFADRIGGPSASFVGLMGSSGSEQAHANGRSGQALYLDGASYLEANDSPGVNFGTGDFTISVWLLQGGGSGVRVIADHRENVAEAQDIRGFVFFTFDGKPGLQIATGSGSGTCASDAATASCVNILSDDSIRDGMWHHLAAVVDRAEIPVARLYVDGEVVKDVRLPGWTGSLSAPATLRIGAQQGIEGARVLDGSLDELAFFDRAIRPSEVEALLNLCD